MRAERQRRYTAEHPDRVRASRAAYYARNRERVVARAVAWRRTAAGKAMTQRRRGVPFTAEAVEYIGIILGDPCSYCGSTTTSVDHVQALSRGGSGEWDNLAPACHSCNSRKRDKSLLSFLLRQPLHH
jgi:5-methylcytosine-specific restriction endonuclease McrA